MYAGLSRSIEHGRESDGFVGAGTRIEPLEDVVIERIPPIRRFHALVGRTSKTPRDETVMRQRLGIVASEVDGARHESTCKRQAQSYSPRDGADRADEIENVLGANACEHAPESKCR
jgi:hypothetical protein